MLSSNLSVHDWGNQQLQKNLTQSWELLQISPGESYVILESGDDLQELLEWRAKKRVQSDAKSPKSRRFRQTGQLMSWACL